MSEGEKEGEEMMGVPGKKFKLSSKNKKEWQDIKVPDWKSQELIVLMEFHFNTFGNLTNGPIPNSTKLLCVQHER